MGAMEPKDEGTSGLDVRGDGRVPDSIVTVVAVGLAIYHLLFISMLLPRVGIYIMTQQHRAVSLGLFLLLTYLIHPVRKSEQGKRIPWYDIVLILASLLPTGYYAFCFSTVQEHMVQGFASTTEVVLALLITIAIIEAGRRVLGWALPIIVIFFVFHALYTEYFPGILFGRAVSLERMVVTAYLSVDGIFGLPIGIASTIVITFMLFSQLLLESGASRFFLNLSLALVGSTRGGPAKVAVIASSLFATLSGSASGNVAATGSITIPLMKSIGYRPYFAGAVEAVASKGGQLTPPIMGAVAFLLAEITGRRYFEVCVVAALPAFLYYISVFLQVDYRAAQTGLIGIPRSELPSLKKTLKEGWQYLIPIFVLIALIAYIRYSPEMAAFYSMVVLWLVTAIRKESRLGLSRIVAGFKFGASTALYAVIPCALAGVILASLAATGLGIRFSGQVINIAGGSLIALVCLAALASFILGMGLATIAIYVILAVLIAPSLVEMGVHILSAHLFIIFWGNLAFITPPVAVAAFIAAGIAGADPMKTGWQACRLGIVSFLVPVMFIWNPALILIGSLGDVVLTALTAIAGVMLLASALEGYFLGKSIQWVSRVILFMSGFLLLLPGWKTLIAGFVGSLPFLLTRIRALVQSRHSRE